MTTFSNYSDLLKKAANKKIYISLSNGWYLPVTKKDLQHLNTRMTEKADEHKFCGNIDEVQEWYIKITLI